MSSELVVDSNVIASFFPVTGLSKEQYMRKRKELLRSLRRAFLIYSDIVIPDTALDELYHFAQKRNVKTELDNLISFLHLTPIIIPRKALGTITSNTPTTSSKFSFDIDASLIEYVINQGADVYTFDYLVQNHITKAGYSSNATFALSLPVDDEKLEQLSFQEIKIHGELFRSTYNKLFEQIKQINAAIVRQQDNILLLTEERNQRVQELQEVINHKDEFISELKDLAKPNIGHTIAFSAIEVVLGFIPFPLPNSPLSHIIDEVQYRKVTSKYEK